MVSPPNYRYVFDVAIRAGPQEAAVRHRRMTLTSTPAKPGRLTNLRVLTKVVAIICGITYVHDMGGHSDSFATITTGSPSANHPHPDALTRITGRVLFP